MEERYSDIYTNEEVDDILKRWVWLYLLACTKFGNYKYKDRFKVVHKYIEHFYADDYTQYVIDLINSEDLNDKNELLVIQNCERISPLFFWDDVKKFFKVKEEYFEERLKYNFDEVTRNILKRD